MRIVTFVVAGVLALSSSAWAVQAGAQDGKPESANQAAPPKPAPPAKAKVKVKSKTGAQGKGDTDLGSAARRELLEKQAQGKTPGKTPKKPLPPKKKSWKAVQKKKPLGPNAKSPKPGTPKSAPPKTDPPKAEPPKTEPPKA